MPAGVLASCSKPPWQALNVVTLPGYESLSRVPRSLHLGNRPPTGPLTTKEKGEAEELRLETLAGSDERKESEQEESRESPDREV